MLYLILTSFFVVIAFNIFKYKQYRKGSYYQITKFPYLFLKYNKGRYLEYLTYKSLCHMETKGGKFLFNLLVPKRNGGITEIDVLLICPEGLFVFECKNFSGWIFGNESQKRWMQTLPKGKGRCHKEQFYNPIMQNASHIKHLKNLIGEKIPIWSIIVFSDRCIFKNITVKSNDIRVINHHKITSELAKACRNIPVVYTEEEVKAIYNKLYPYSQA